jgi:hypothetical protein
MASLYKPSDIVTHEGPPITKGDMSVCGEIPVMSCIIVSSGEYERTTILWYYEFVFAFTILTPESFGVYEEFSTIA